MPSKPLYLISKRKTGAHDNFANKYINKIIKWRKSILAFVQDIWGLQPQPAIHKYKYIIDACIKNNEFFNISASYFGNFNEDTGCWYWEGYDPSQYSWAGEWIHKNNLITWQQWGILLSIEFLCTHESKRRLSIRSGHGIGKSSVFSWIILWGLVCFHESQIACSAPTGSQLYDNLWKEISVWYNRMPDYHKQNIVISSDHIRMKSNPKSWFARARTGDKENPDALAGLHSMSKLLFLADEASGIPTEIFTVSEGALTTENYLYVMASNPRRQSGYYYESFGKDIRWYNLHFDSRESPLVTKRWIDDFRLKYGEDSNEWRFMVEGKFPKEDTVDTKGYYQLVSEKMYEDSLLKDIGEIDWTENVRLGIDPSGSGKDETVWCLRDEFHSKTVLKEKVSTPKGIASRTVGIIKKYKVKSGATDTNVFIDNFGIGADVRPELILLGHHSIGINVGDGADEKDRFLNKRAEAYYRQMKWLKNGGKIAKTESSDDILVVRCTEEGKKFRIMSKKDMRKEGYKSPNDADARMLTFVKKETKADAKRGIVRNREVAKHKTKISKINKMFMTAKIGV